MCLSSSTGAHPQLSMVTVVTQQQRQQGAKRSFFVLLLRTNGMPDLRSRCF